MDPALRERIEARIAGRRAGAGRKVSPLAVALLRFAALTIIVSLVVVFALGRQRYQQEITHSRAALLDKVRAEAASLTEDDLKTPERVHDWLLRSGGAYAGDFVAEELKSPDALAARLKRPMIYMRSELATFSSTRSIRASAPDGRKDPFVLCLVDPPGARTERDQLKKVHAAYAGGERAERPTSQVRVLVELEVGLPLLTPSWQADIEAAGTPEELERLTLAFERAPIAWAKQAAKARQLLFAMDEPSDAKGPSELDGERAHPVRVGLIDLAAERVLLRLRRNVDPKWISASRRADYAKGLDSCALALDVRDSVTAPVAQAHALD
jgi:hypothetical protein